MEKKDKNFHIQGRKIPKNKGVLNGLTHLYGIGRKEAQNICDFLGIIPQKLIKNLSFKEKQGILRYLQTRYKGKVTEALLKKKRDAVRNLITIRNYRGLRHKSLKPVRGQRTKTNAQTQKRVGIINIFPKEKVFFSAKKKN